MTAPPDPKQENSKATVGVEVPEAVEAAEKRLTERYPFILTQVFPVSPRTLAEHALAAAVPHIEQAIRNEEREKVLGELLSEAAVDAAETEYDRVRNMENDEWDAQGFDDGESYGRLMLKAAARSLPIDAMEEPQCKECGAPKGLHRPPCSLLKTKSAAEIQQLRRRVLDCDGKLITRGAKVRRGDYERTVVVISPAYNGVVSIGTYHGSLDEYQPNMCIPFTPAEKNDAGDFVAADLQLVPDCQPPDSLDRGGEAAEQVTVTASRDKVEMTLRWVMKLLDGMSGGEAEVYGPALVTFKNQLRDALAPDCTDQPAPKEEEDSDG